MEQVIFTQQTCFNPLFGRQSCRRKTLVAAQQVDSLTRTLWAAVR